MYILKKYYCLKNTLKKKQEPPTASTPTTTTTSNSSAISNSSNAASNNGQGADNVLPSISTRTGQTTVPCLEKEVIYAFVLVLFTYIYFLSYIL